MPDTPIPDACNVQVSNLGFSERRTWQQQTQQAIAQQSQVFHRSR